MARADAAAAAKHAQLHTALRSAVAAAVAAREQQAAQAAHAARLDMGIRQQQAQHREQLHAERARAELKDRVLLAGGLLGRVAVEAVEGAAPPAPPTTLGPLCTMTRR